ncbi:hypothetical protein KUTeg_015908 [Tegillarca granosa]|uniref:Ankyrin repeat protein n=1 Tax=Tegillarca granosa TaxID=220873 RepID=A0ABQ9EJA7_TEGGR|nr:hypothetical protein KUTeg_015908 [Tegillarca granosa]
MEKQIGSISRPSLQQIILQSANRKTMTILNGIVNIICEKHPSYNWSDLLNIKDKYGMGALHYAASRGYSLPIHIWAERLGNVHFKESSKLDAFDSYTRTDSPVFYALANKHWDIAICLLLNGSQPLFKKCVPDFYAKGRFNLNRTDDKYEPACLSEKDFWTSSNEEKSLLQIDWMEKRTFPQQVNSSKLVSPCLSYKNGEQNKTEAAAESKKLINPKYKCNIERINHFDQGYEKKKYVKYLFQLTRIASNNNCSLIHVACCIGDIEIVQRIIKAHPGATEAEDVDGIKPFIYAIAGGNLEIIDLLRTQLNLKNVEEAIRVLIWKGVLKDLENAKNLVFDDSFKPISTNSNIYLDKRKFKIIFSFLSSFELDDAFGSKTEDNISQDYSNLILFEKLREVRDKICTSRLSKRWASISFSNINGKRPDLFEERYLLESFKFVFNEGDLIKLDPTLKLSIIALGRPRVMEEFVRKWKKEDGMLASMEKPLIGNFSILDCLIICIEPYFNRTRSQGYYFEQYQRLIEDIISTSNVSLNPEVAIVAIKKKQWILFEPIARKIFQQKGVELSPYWLNILRASIEEGELSFLKTVLELIGFPKMNEENKQVFVPFLYLACLKGKSDIVKYLLRYNVPVSPIIDELLTLDILGKHYKGSWTILHYAVKSNSSEVLKIIIRCCRYDRLLLQSIPLEEIFQLAIECKDNSIFYILKEYFEETTEATLTLTQQEHLLIYAAKNGYGSFCTHFIEKRDVSIF